ncbi:MAG: TolC family protein, partial [Methylocystis sp.]
MMVSAALCGCDLTWEKPDLGAPPPARFREAKPRPAPPIAAGRDFAVKFGSQELTGLVERALDDNLAIAAAIARIEQADANARIASAALWPLASFGGLAQRTQIPGTQLSATPNFNPAQSLLQGAGKSQAALLDNQATFSAARTNLFALGLNASYEIDFWGKNEDASKAARLLANASRFDRDVVEIATAAA